MIISYVGLFKIGPDRKTGPDRTANDRTGPDRGIYGPVFGPHYLEKTVPVRSGPKPGFFRVWTGWTGFY